MKLLDGKALRNGLIATALLAAAIVVGSRSLTDFDSAVVGYTFACLAMTFGVVYRYSVWLSKPATRLYWRRGWQVLFSPRMWPRLGRLGLLVKGVGSRLVTHDFIYRRSPWRWVGHALIAWGCVLAVAVTFPLVFGWIHFEPGRSVDGPSYQVIVWGLSVADLPVHSPAAFLMFHALVISAFMVIPGVMIATWRRLKDRGAASVQRFALDFLPLAELFVVSVSGLLLWVSYTWLGGYFFQSLAFVHALSVIGTLVHVSFGKLFHVFQRPASVGIVFYRAAGEQGESARCPVTGEDFAPALQVKDLKGVLQETGLDYRPSEGDGPGWSELSPKGRRVLLGQAHRAAKHGRFN